ncbi:dTDP-4-dehydrorhamnose 3,5-epimerase [soil metagenome]
MTTITPLALPDVLLITPKRHGDARGWFMETWSRRAFADAGLDFDFVQDNHAFSGEAGTVRGLHFQAAPHPQAKLLRVVRGSILDVAVDIRSGSATYGKWVSATLTAEGGEQLLVPRGFAHGYCTLTPDTELAYKVDGLYAPETEGSILWNDPDLAIDWPAFAGSVVSEKDKAARPLKDLGPVSF